MRNSGFPLFNRTVAYARRQGFTSKFLCFVTHWQPVSSENRRFTGRKWCIYGSQMGHLRILNGAFTSRKWGIYGLQTVGSPETGRRVSETDRPFAGLIR